VVEVLVVLMAGLLHTAKYYREADGEVFACSVLAPLRKVSRTHAPNITSRGSDRGV
jgi:hypothetical protein